MLTVLWRWFFQNDTEFWLAMEGRFARIEGEVEGIWSINQATGKIDWSVYPTTSKQDPEGSGARRLDRFIRQASLAGRQLKRVRSMSGTYRVNPDASDEDRWLSAVGAWVHRASSIKGSGIDNTSGESKRSESRPIERLIEASEDFCAHLSTLRR